ncbi:MAG: RdgB/HAM1 family non-canonical purine NTP pyrophosphatase [Muribaculaceae bacterium]|nr:RdgB/HAM1 family non-canonical purine NTP pyrophosphatase [Muribaculaceae bacterium]
MTATAKIVFATNNAHKLAELRQMLGHRFGVLSLDDIGCHDDIPETGNSFRENALQKARWVKERYGYDCFADDSGLEVDALGGAPGILSARYAGSHGDSRANNDKLLAELDGIADRRARFRCSIALLHGSDDPVFFDGTVEGEIILAPDGSAGFGYDPLFRPLGWDCTFAQASPDRKNAISHRGKAVEALVRYLEKLH